jgi:hypothetical protein
MTMDNMLGRKSRECNYKDCKMINANNYSKEDSILMLLDKKIRKLRSSLHQKMAMRPDLCFIKRMTWM